MNPYNKCLFAFSLFTVSLLRFIGESAALFLRGPRRPPRISISRYISRRLRVAKPRSAFILRNGFSDKVSRFDVHRSL